jgi:hypothetical protein
MIPLSNLHIPPPGVAQPALLTINEVAGPAEKASFGRRFGVEGAKEIYIC